MKNIELFFKYLYGKHWGNHPTIYAEKFIKFLIQRNFDGFLIDAGCGNGRDTDVFADRLPMAKVLGIDNDQAEIYKASQTHRFNVFIKDDIEELNLPNDFAGAIFMINVIHYVDQKKALSEIFRVLRPGGYFFIHFNLEIVDNDNKIDYRHDEGEIKKLISPFKIINEEKFERLDPLPVEHTHRILELILQKPEKTEEI